MGRGPGKLQRDILAAVAEHGPITTAALADLVVGPLEYWPSYQAMLTAEHPERLEPAEPGSPRARLADELGTGAEAQAPDHSPPVRADAAPSAYKYEYAEAESGGFNAGMIRVSSERYPTRASQTRRRNLRRAVQGLIRTGRLVERRRPAKVVVRMEGAELLDEARNQAVIVGELLGSTWERTVTLPEQSDQNEG